MRTKKFILIAVDGQDMDKKGHVAFTEYRDDIIPDGRVTIWDKQSLVMFQGPPRVSEPPYPKLEEHQRCHINDHLFEMEAFATIIPNKFPLCKYHFNMMWPTMKRMLRYHYGMEQPHRRYY